MIHSNIGAATCLLRRIMMEESAQQHLVEVSVIDDTTATSSGSEIVRSLSCETDKDTLSHALFTASALGQISVVEHLIVQCNANIDSVHPTSGFTALLFACQQGHLPIVQYLMQTAKARVDVTSHAQENVLHLACTNGHLPVVQFLIQACSTSLGEARDENDMTPLCVAALNGHATIVQYLVEQMAADTEAKWINDGTTALHLAASRGHVPIVSYLIANEDAKLNADATTNQGETPLHWAVFQGQTEVVKCLVELGHADVEAKCGENGLTPLMIASMDGHLSMVEYLVEHAKANVEAVGTAGTTPLMEAVSSGHVPVVKYLLQEAGASMEGFDTTDVPVNVWFRAVGSAHLPVIKYLGEEWPQTNVHYICPHTQMTALHLASAAGHLPVVKYLVEDLGLDITKRTRSNGWTPLDFAIHCKHSEIEEYLSEIERAPDTDAADDTARLDEPTTEPHAESIVLSPREDARERTVEESSSSSLREDPKEHEMEKTVEQSSSSSLRVDDTREHEMERTVESSSSSLRDDPIPLECTPFTDLAEDISFNHQSYFPIFFLAICCFGPIIALSPSWYA